MLLHLIQMHHNQFIEASKHLVLSIQDSEDHFCKSTLLGLTPIWWPYIGSPKQCVLQLSGLLRN